MINMVKTKRMELLSTLATGIFFLVVGTVIGFISDMPELAPMFFLFGTCFITLLITFVSNVIVFNTYVGMGKTRKSYIGTTLGISIIKYTIVMFIGYLMDKIETEMIVSKKSLAGFFKADIVILIVVLICAVELISGSLVLKFGTKAYWILWIISMMICMLPARFESAMSSEKDSILKSISIWCMEHITQITRMQGIGIGLVIAVILIGISSCMLLRQDVK